MAKTKANVDYTTSGTGAPAAGDMQVWDGKEWVSAATFFELLGNMIITKAPHTIALGDVSAAPSVALQPRRDRVRDIGTPVLRFRNLHIDKLFAYNEINLMNAAGNIQAMFDLLGTDAVVKNASGAITHKFHQNGDFTMFYDE